jgi:hypothetical protein
VNVKDLIAMLQRMPPEASLVFEDACEEEGSYEDVEVEFNPDGEVVIRTV